MSTVKFNADFINNQFRPLVINAEKQIRTTYNRTIGVRSPYGFSNASDITNLLNVLRNCSNDLNNYINWLDRLQRSYEDIVNSNFLNMRAIEKVNIPVRDKVVIKK